MTKTELIYEVANKTGLSKKDAEKALGAFFDVVASEIKSGNKVAIAGFGTFEASLRAARSGRNPQTGEVMDIPASKTVKFKAGKTLKDQVK